MKILLASLAAALLAAAAPSGAAVPAQINRDYIRCVTQNMLPCYPIDENGNIYRPSPETAEGIAFEACAAAVRADCADLYPG